jgi:hypothetical protein
MLSGELNTIMNYTVCKKIYRSIVKAMKVARTRWLGHLVRMEENSPCKKMTSSQLEGSRKKGRPKLRWLDSVIKDVKLLKVETWWKKALNRNM